MKTETQLRFSNRPAKKQRRLAAEKSLRSPHLAMPFKAIRQLKGTGTQQAMQDCANGWHSHAIANEHLQIFPTACVLWWGIKTMQAKNLPVVKDSITLKTVPQRRGLATLHSVESPGLATNALRDVAKQICGDAPSRLLAAHGVLGADAFLLASVKERQVEKFFSRISLPGAT